jgi:hypothetical protein
MFRLTTTSRQLARKQPARLRLLAGDMNGDASRTARRDREARSGADARSLRFTLALTGQAALGESARRHAGAAAGLARAARTPEGATSLAALARRTRRRASRSPRARTRWLPRGSPVFASSNGSFSCDKVYELEASRCTRRAKRRGRGRSREFSPSAEATGGSHGQVEVFVHQIDGSVHEIGGGLRERSLRLPAFRRADVILLSPHGATPQPPDEC